MSNDNTLATAKHGGCMQLPTWERERFEACAHAQSYRGGNILTDRDADHPDVYADPLAQLAWKIWQAALAAQPSPGGQGDSRSQFEEYRGGDCERDAQGYYTNARTAQDWAMWQAALAARQPVYVQGCDELRARTEGERAAYLEGIEEGKKIAARQPVGEPEPYVVGNQYFTQAGDLVRFVAVHNEGTCYECMEDESGVNRYTRRDFGRVTGSAHDYSDPRNTPPLYAAPTVQAVDLGRFRKLASWVANCAGHGINDSQRRLGEELLALIDSQAVGK